MFETRSQKVSSRYQKSRDILKNLDEISSSRPELWFIPSQKHLRPCQLGAVLRRRKQWKSKVALSRRCPMWTSLGNTALCDTREIPEKSEKLSKIYIFKFWEVTGNVEICRRSKGTEKNSWIRARNAGFIWWLNPRTNFYLKIKFLKIFCKICQLPWC